MSKEEEIVLLRREIDRLRQEQTNLDDQLRAWKQLALAALRLDVKDDDVEDEDDEDDEDDDSEDNDEDHEDCWYDEDHEDFWFSWWKHVPESLKEDRDCLAAAVEGGYIVWHKLPERWHNDAKIVAAAVKSKRNPQNWIDLPEHWRNNPEVVLAAIEKRSKDGKGEPLPDWLELSLECRSNRQVLLAALERGLEGLCWEDLPEDLKQSDRNVILYGVQHEGLDPDAYPCLADRAFMKRQVSKGEISWDCLPTELRNDIEFARSIEAFQDLRDPDDILSWFSSLRQDRAMWEKILKCAKKKIMRL